MDVLPDGFNAFEVPSDWQVFSRSRRRYHRSTGERRFSDMVGLTSVVLLIGSFSSGGILGAAASYVFNVAKSEGMMKAITLQLAPSTFDGNKYSVISNV
jgi:hypothetical protein